MSFGGWPENQHYGVEGPRGFAGHPPRVAPWFQSAAITDGFSTSVVATAPADIKIGDLLLAVCSTRDDSSSNWVLPTGWFNLVPVFAAGGTDRGGRRIAYKIANDADTKVASWTFATVGNNNQQINIICIRGIDPDPIGGFYNSFSVAQPGKWCAGVTSRFINDRYGTSGTVGINHIPQICVPEPGCLVVVCTTGQTNNNGFHPVWTYGAPYSSLSQGGAFRTGASWGIARPERAGVFPTTSASLSMSSGGGETNTEHVTTICIRGALQP